MNQTYYDIIFGTMSGFTICDTFNEYIKNTNSKIKNFNDLNNSNQKIYDLNSQEDLNDKTRIRKIIKNVYSYRQYRD